MLLSSAGGPKRTSPLISLLMYSQTTVVTDVALRTGQADIPDVSGPFLQDAVLLLHCGDLEAREGSTEEYGPPICGRPSASSEYHGFAVGRGAYLVKEAVGISEGQNLRAAVDAVVYGFHVIGDDDCVRSRLVNGQGVFCTRDEIADAVRAIRYPKIGLSPTSPNRTMR